MENLATLNDLPQKYQDDLKGQNLVPLWPSLRNLLPPLQPKPLTQTVVWKYQEIKPLLLQAGELTPIEKAERRVLVLANPGHDLNNLKASSVIYMGMQLLLPNEVAPSHRHTPNAVRLVVEGNGAYTTVEGQKCMMQKGDLILTPTGLWHEHGHDGDEPVIWLDILDLPIVHHIEASYVEQFNGKIELKDDQSSRYKAGLVPLINGHRAEISPKNSTILRYPWVETKALLEQLATIQKLNTSIQISFVNPETGQAVQKIIGYSALMLRPQEYLKLKRRSCAQIFHIIEGSAQLTVDHQQHILSQSDTLSAACFSTIEMRNENIKPCFIFIADESEIQKNLGLYSEKE
jgi:gentisate 1,2-dioxygenase